jgi:hypothetical protein
MTDYRVNFTLSTSQRQLQEYYLVKTWTHCKSNFLHVVEPEVSLPLLQQHDLSQGLLKYLISFTVMDISHRPPSSLEDSHRYVARESSFNVLAATPLTWMQSLPSIP